MDLSGCRMRYWVSLFVSVVSLSSISVIAQYPDYYNGYRHDNERNIHQKSDWFGSEQAMYQDQDWVDRIGLEVDWKTHKEKEEPECEQPDPVYCTAKDMHQIEETMRTCFKSKKMPGLKTGEQVLMRAKECTDQNAVTHCSVNVHKNFKSYTTTFLTSLRNFALESMSPGVSQLHAVKHNVPDDRECFKWMDYKRWVICHLKFFSYAREVMNGLNPPALPMGQCFKRTHQNMAKCRLPLVIKLAEIIPKAFKYKPPGLICKEFTESPDESSSASPDEPVTDKGQTPSNTDETPDDKGETHGDKEPATPDTTSPTATDGTGGPDEPEKPNKPADCECSCNDESYTPTKSHLRKRSLDDNNIASNIDDLDAPSLVGIPYINIDYFNNAYDEDINKEIYNRNMEKQSLFESEMACIFNTNECLKDSFDFCISLLKGIFGESCSSEIYNFDDSAIKGSLTATVTENCFEEIRNSCSDLPFLCSSKVKDIKQLTSNKTVICKLSSKTNRL